MGGVDRPSDAFLLAVGVSFLPSRVKHEERWAPYVSDTVHAASGLAQAALVAGIYLWPLIMSWSR